MVWDIVQANQDDKQARPFTPLYAPLPLSFLWDSFTHQVFSSIRIPYNFANGVQTDELFDTGRAGTAGGVAHVVVRGRSCTG